jgi:hypothetical protein
MQDQAIKHLNQHGDVVLDCTGTTVHYSSMISCIMTSATLVGRSLVVRLACSELSSVARGHKVPTSNFNWIAKAASRIAADVTIITDHELPTVASLNEHLVALHRKPLTGSAVARGEVAYDRRGHRKPFVPAVRKKRRSGNELP